MKKLFLIILAVCLCCAACTAGAEEDGFAAIFSQPAGQMQKELALLSAKACDAAYDREKIIQYLVELGFPQADIRQQDYLSDSSHSTGITLARRVIRDPEGKKMTLYAVIVRGTGSTQEWISNFTLGNEKTAMGFQLAAERAFAHLQSYMAEHLPAEEGRYCLWLCGHSRGGAVVNLLAAEWAAAFRQDRLYAYTFGTPNVQQDADEQANIFNFLYENDVVTRLPFSEWGFGRNGRDIFLAVKEGAAGSREAIDRFVDVLLQQGMTLERYLQLTAPVFQAIQAHPDIDPMLYFGALLPSVQLSGQEVKDDLAALLAGMMDVHPMESYIEGLTLLP